MFNRKGSRSTYVIVFLSAVLVYFLYLMVPWLDNNPWGDESYTIKRFTLVPLSVILTDYHAPNNHMLFNICDHFYLRSIGIRSFAAVLADPWVIRLPLLFLSLVTLLLIYRTGRLVGGAWAGILSLAFLATEIPFQNFCLQIRGYGFTLFFDTLVVYGVFLFLTHSGRKHLFLIAVSATLAIYTLPSNLYFAMAVMAFLFCEAGFSFLKGKPFFSEYVGPLVAVSVGIAFAILCYSPILGQMYNNEFIHPTFHPSRLIDATFFYGELIHGRKMLYVLFVIAALVYFSPLVPRSVNITRLWHLSAWQIIIQIAGTVLSGQYPTSRVFIYLCVFLSLLVATTIAYLLRLLFRQSYHAFIAALIVVYLMISCQMDKEMVDKVMERNIQQGVVTEELVHDFYLYHYTPMAITREMATISKNDPACVILKPYDMAYYLTAFNVPYHSLDSIDYFLSLGRRVIIINPFRIEKRLAGQHHCTVREIRPPSFHHVLELSADSTKSASLSEQP